MTPLEQTREEGRFGGKAVQLGAALRAGLPVPGGFALDWETVAKIVSGSSGVLGEVARALPMMRGVAVRSSAIGEDSAAASFAGQHATVLGVRSEADLRGAVLQVHASGSTESALAYRAKLGIGTGPQMAIVIQPLVHAEVAGVLFSRDPITGEDVRTVEASWGLGEAVVAGMVTPDNFKFARGGKILSRTAGEKDIAIRWNPDGGGTMEEEVDGELIETLCLSDEQLVALDALASRCESVFGGTQDLEFAFENDTLYLLQRRAITRG
jgi:pyruvate, water dikinase